MLDNTINEIIGKLFLFGLELFLVYIKYFFLTISVVLSVNILLLTIVIINPEFAFNFLEYFSFINPAYNTGSFEMRIEDIMKIFLVVSFGLMIVINLIKIILNNIFKFNINISFKKKVILFSLIISLIYSYAFIIISTNQMFITFYLISLVATIIYLFLDKLSDKIHGLR